MSHRVRSLSGSTFFPSLLALTMSLLVCAAEVFAAPTISNVSLRGLQIEGSTILTIDGTDLLPDPQVLMAIPLAKQTIQPGGTATRVQIEVVVAGTASPGIHLLRVANAKGISNSVAIGVDRLPQQPFTAEIAALPVALHGNVAGDQRPRTSFNGKKDQRLVVDVESQRLGAALKPIVRLFDGRGVQLTWSAQRVSLGGDSRLETVLPADGQYTVEIHDLLYRAGNPGFFRMKLGDIAFADLSFPLGVKQGTKGTVEYLSTNLPAGTKAEMDVTAVTQIGTTPVPLLGHPNFTGRQPGVVVSEHNEFAETAGVASPQPVGPAPVGISGRISATGEQDRYLLEVTPGAKLVFDVLARRIGSPLDGVLTILGEQGNGLASNDDRPGTSDPGLEFTVPANVTKLQVAMNDLQGRGGNDFVYRISVRDANQPDFAISLPTDRLHVATGSSQVVKVQVARTTYQGPIQLRLEGAPANIQLAGDLIPAGSSMSLLTVTAPASGFASGEAKLVGVAMGVPTPPSKIATLPENNMTRFQPWLRSGIGVAITEPGPITLAWQPSSAEEKLPAGGKLVANLSFARAEGVTGAIRVKLLSTQPMPRKKVKKNNVDVEEDDVDRSLRLEGTPQFGPEVKEAAVNILVPIDLPQQAWGLVLVAELLAADNKTVVAEVSTPYRSLTVAPPPGEMPRELFEDDEKFVALLTSGGGQASLEPNDKHFGKASLKVTPDQRFADALPNLGMKIRENPGPGEFRYLRFAWKKKGGAAICLQINHDGTWGPGGTGKPDAKFRYHAGPGGECYSASILVDEKLPEGFVVVTRDLFSDFGEFTLTSLAFSPIDGEYALFDHLYLGRTSIDFDRLKPQ